MSTNSFSSAIDHSSDANFRTWYGEIRTAMAAVGMVQTSDTGQVNPATMTRPGTSTFAGYEIWRFADTLQATAPIYIKIEMGTGSATTRPTLAITVGTGTNGAGTLTGVVSTRQVIDAGVPAATSWPSYFCHISGFFGFEFKHGAITNAAQFAVAICRTCDSSGVATGDGCTIYLRTASGATGVANVQALRFIATTATYTQHTSGQYTVIPHGVTDSSVGSDKQVYLHLTITPRVAPVFGMVSYLNSEYAAGTTFSVAMVGTTARTYLATNNGFGYGAAVGTTTYGIAMLYE